MGKTIFFSVGEPSGDQHAARLIQHLSNGTDIQTRGFGGTAMAGAGCKLDRDLTEHAVVGLVEVHSQASSVFWICG